MLFLSWSLGSSKSPPSMKYRIVETMSITSATTSTSSKKKNPARARRSRLRLEQFNKKKEDEKLNKQQTGSQTAAGAKLVLNLAREEQIMPVATGSLSPILQLDGEVYYLCYPVMCSNNKQNNIPALHLLTFIVRKQTFHFICFSCLA